MSNPVHGALAGLPAVFETLVPELATIDWPLEAAATCSNCAMVQPHPHREVFLDSVRCCTFFPRLVNFSVGRVLLQGGPGADAVHRLLQGGASLVPLGIQPEPAWLDQYQTVGPDGFGHTAHLRCPYWVGGELACGVWSERNHVCRTWFCKHDEGERGQALWAGLRDVLGRAGRVLADALVDGGDAPDDGSDPDVWEAWFIDCAHRLGAVAAAVDDPTLVDLRSKLRDRDADRRTPLPEVLGASLMKWQVGADGGWVYSYSPYDEAAVPGDIWQLLSRLDGERTWQQAVAETRAAGFGVDDGLLPELFRVGAVEARTPGETEPGLAKVRLQETDGRWRHMGMVAVEKPSP